MLGISFVGCERSGSAVTQLGSASMLFSSKESLEWHLTGTGLFHLEHLSGSDPAKSSGCGHTLGIHLGVELTPTVCSSSSGLPLAPEEEMDCPGGTLQLGAHGHPSPRHLLHGQGDFGDARTNVSPGLWCLTGA